MNGQTSNDDGRAMPRILVVEVETTSLNAETGSILEIGATWLLGDGGEDQHFFIRCRPWEGSYWDEESERVHGITLAEANDPSRPTEDEAVREFVAWIGQLPVMMAGLNPSHDRAFIHAALRRSPETLSTVKIFPHRCIDLHTLAISYAVASAAPLPTRGLYTDEIYELLGMEPEPKPHRANSGALWEAIALRMLMGIPEHSEPVPYEIAEGQGEREKGKVSPELAQLALELCWQIETCGASEALTKASVMASELRQKIVEATAPQS